MVLATVSARSTAARSAMSLEKRITSGAFTPTVVPVPGVTQYRAVAEAGGVVTVKLPCRVVTVPSAVAAAVTW